MKIQVTSLYTKIIFPAFRKTLLSKKTRNLWSGKKPIYLINQLIHSLLIYQLINSITNQPMYGISIELEMNEIKKRLRKTSNLRLTHLSFDSDFNQPIGVGSIPASVSSLKFAIRFNQLVTLGSIPTSATHSTIGSDFNQLNKWIADSWFVHDLNCWTDLFNWCIYVIMIWIDWQICFELLMC